MTFPIHETTLVFAFRYALNRRTGATTHMVKELERHWNRLADQTKQQIQREIAIAIEGSECEIETWEPVLSWSKDECPACDMIYYNCVCGHDEEDSHL